MSTIDGTPSYCQNWGEEEPHSDFVDLSLEPFEHGPVTIAILRLFCDRGDEAGVELGRDELLILRARIDDILTARGEAPDDYLPAEQQARLTADPRLITSCAACEHPGYMHKDAERQYEVGPYGVPEFEAGDIRCEAEQDTGGYVNGCGCDWYEGDNWESK